MFRCPRVKSRGIRPEGGEIHFKPLSWKESGGGLLGTCKMLLSVSIQIIRNLYSSAHHLAPRQPRKQTLNREAHWVPLELVWTTKMGPGGLADRMWSAWGCQPA